jgi:ribose 5-phosphate isomerase A
VTAAEQEKRAAGRAAAALVRDGMAVGLGTGSTVKHFVDALAERGLTGLRCIATSPATEDQARGLGLAVEGFDRLERLDIAVDGADQIAPDGWIVKGGGGAHLREKIVAAAANRFVVIADASKVVDALRPPVPLEILRFGAPATLAALRTAMPRDAPPSPDGGLIADFHGDVGDPAALAARLAAIPGVVEHGLFGPDLTSDVIIARGEELERRAIG